MLILCIKSCKTCMNSYKIIYNITLYTRIDIDIAKLIVLYVILDIDVAKL